jgi:hypothetical protein
MSAGGRNRFAWLAPVGVLALLASACSGGASPDVPPATAGDAGTLIEQALDARSADDYDGFVDNLRTAAAQCPDPTTASRLDEVAEIAASWSAAVLDGRPKVQATTERQLDGVDWDGLAAACAGS